MALGAATARTVQAAGAGRIAACCRMSTSRRAVPAPRRPGLVARLFRLFAGRPRDRRPRRPDAAESGPLTSALGETERKSYAWVSTGNRTPRSRAHRRRANRLGAAPPERSAAPSCIRKSMRCSAGLKTRLDPFPPEEPVEPPKTLVAFCLHYTQGAWPYIVGRGDAHHGDRARRSLDVRLPRQHRRLAVGAEPRDLPADRGLEARRHGVRRAGRAAGDGVRAVRCSTSRR